MSSSFLFSNFGIFPNLTWAMAHFAILSVSSWLRLPKVRSGNWWLVNSLLQQHLPVINFVDFWCFDKNKFSGAQYWLSSTWRSHQSGTVRLRFSPHWWLFIVCAVHILSHLTDCISQICSLVVVHTIVVCDPGWISHHWQLLIFTLLGRHASSPTFSTLLRSLKNWETKDEKCCYRISALFSSAGCVVANISHWALCAIMMKVPLQSMVQV